MAEPFKRTRRGVRVQLDEAERALLARLLEDVEEMLALDAAERGGVPGGPEGGPDGGPNGGPNGGGGGAPLADDAVLAALEASLDVPPPSDPAVARLLPEGNRDDPELAAGYRRLVQDELRERKRARLGSAGAALARPAPVLLDDAEAVALLKGLTDVRLVLAERLGLRTDEDAELVHARVMAQRADDPVAVAATLYDALTWWQESLVHALR